MGENDIMEMNIDESYDGPKVKHADYVKMTKEEKEKFAKDIKDHLEKKGKSHNESAIMDIMNVLFTEESEFAHHNPDTNHPSDHFETGGAAAHKTSAPAMGNHNNYDETSVTIPEGDSETPKAKPYDASSVSVPSKTVMDSNTYNDALAALKKSFKEGYEIMEMLENVTVVDDTMIKQQEAFEEAAIIEAMISGPIFEAVNRSDKEAIRKIVKDIRADVVDEIEKEGLDFYDLGWWNKLKSFLGLRVAGQNFYWQMIGMVDIETQNADDFCKRLTTKFEEQLGKYKILCYQCWGHAQLFNFKNLKSELAGDTKNTRKTFLLFVDRKMNSELKNEMDSIRKEVESKLKKDNKK